MKPQLVAFSIFLASALRLYAGDAKQLAPAEVMPTPEKDWELILSAPMWGAGLYGDVGVAGYQPVAVEVPLEKILENLDMIGALTIEARHRRWGFILDGLYLKMSAGGETPGSLLSTVDVQVEQVLAEASLTYRILEGDRGYLDLLAGARYVYIGTELNFQLDSGGVDDISNRLSDAIVNRAVDKIEAEVRRVQELALARIETADVCARADALQTELRSRVRTAAIEKALENNAIRDIISTIRNLTPAERALVIEKVQDTKEIAAANKALARAVVEDRVSAAVDNARNRARSRASRAVEKAKKRLAQAIDTAIRNVVPQSVSASKSWVDPFVGFRGKLLLTEKLYMVARGDIGGFSVGSDLSWNAFGAIGYQWNDRISTDLGYRYLSLDYSDGGFLFDADMRGVFLGLNIAL